jgi:ABC-2 type transport system ATP-binding protein
LIEVHGLTKHFAGRPAILDLTFTVARGQVVGLLGPRGAGKTTTMRILAGCLGVTSGSAVIGGGDVLGRWRRSRRRLGYLPEGAPLDHEMGVQPYLETMCRLRGVAPRDLPTRVAAALAACGLEARRGEIIGDLPADVRRRVCLAQAVVHDPHVLILDEPTGGLEPEPAAEMRALVADVSRGRTAIVSSRGLADLSAACERVLVIRRGRLAADTTLGDLRRARAKGGHRQVLAVVRGDAAAVTRRLRRVAGVVSVDVDEIGDGEHRLTVTGDGDDLQDGVARAIVRRGVELRELSSRDLVPDDILEGIALEEA